MKNDKKIERLVREIAVVAQTWAGQVQALGNQNAATDRILDELLAKTEKLGELHRGNK